MKRLFSSLAVVLSLMFTTSWMPLGDAVAAASATAQEVAASVNVNVASVKELQTLPGIGRVTAERVVDYRAANGSFSSPEDLLKVKGIGKATLQKIRDRIVLQ